MVSGAPPALFTTHYSLFANLLLHSIPREFLRDVRLDRLGGGHVGVAARIVFLPFGGAAAVERAGVLRVLLEHRVVVGDGAVELAGLEPRELADDERIRIVRP